MTVLVTGAGGYIGSALVRAIAAAHPARLVLLDSSEQNLFQIHRSLEDGDVAHEAVLGSVTDAGPLHRLLARVRPQLIYHAAAWKHVALLEWNPLAAVANNAIGTYTLAQAAIEHGVTRLVLVSTDKAVKPHSIMGASKRVAELIVTALSSSRCRMNVVRLGNVIGSTGSAVPIFLEQIARGGPVTVTDREATRYFISLGEAVDAILAAGVSEASGRILLPEMGEPERIADVARSLIGDRNGIAIRFIGLRAGEKLREDLMLPEESREGVAGRLHVIRTPGPPAAELHASMAELGCLIARGDVPGVVEWIRELVPEYAPSRVVCALR